jgi:beta-glucosidase
MTSDRQIDLEKLKDEPWHFGRDFLWGSATAAYQVEGYCTNNNWYQFETATDERGRPRILNGQRAGACCDHWNRYAADIQLMKALSLNAYRFSVEWSKIEPEQGKFDEAALGHYEGVVDELRKNGIEPMITLHHFTDPIWFGEKGAFLQENAPEIFGNFVERVVRRLGQKVKLWGTINEPTVYATQGYQKGRFPPALKDPGKVSIVLRNLYRAHTTAYQRIKEIDPAAQVGLVAAIMYYEPSRWWHPLDVMQSHALNRGLNESHLTYLVDGVFDLAIPDGRKLSYRSGVKEAFDFFGLNYYSRFRHKFAFRERDVPEIPKLPPEKLTDMGWEIYPEGLYRALEMITRYTSKPIYITENGIADDSDTKRAGFIEDHLRVLNKALADGMNVKGYFYWSLLDNFEWAFGFTKRFGLYHVDFATQKRTLKAGSRKYLEIILASRG